MYKRQEIAADGEDVAICTVEVQDAQGRVVPITENDVTFKVTGPGEVIGTGNGDPTNQEPDKGTSRKAFSGLCMGLVQSTKTLSLIHIWLRSVQLRCDRLCDSGREECSSDSRGCHRERWLVL